MSDSRYSYDEEGLVWPYFALTLVSAVLVPWTISTFLRVKKSFVAVPVFGSSPSKALRDFRARNKWSLFNDRSFWIISAGWVFVSALIFIIKTQEIPEDKRRFDPYALLDVAFSATQKEIKKAYRNMSFKYHPDKVNLSLLNKTREEVESLYIDISKAYKALTDEDTRQNYIKYGHPDGPQEKTHGIALPQFLVDGKGQLIVLPLYMLSVIVVLPWVVGSWWAGQSAYTSDGIHQETATIFLEKIVKEQPNFVTYDIILDLLSRAKEYEILLHLAPAQVKELLVAYLERKTVANEGAKLTAASRAFALLDGLLKMAAEFKDFGLCSRIINVQRCFVEAVPIDKIAEGQRAQVPEGFTGSYGPALKFVSAGFKTVGEDVVPPGTAAHLTLEFEPAKTASSEANPFDAIDVNSPKYLKDPTYSNKFAAETTPVFPPYYPVAYRPTWQVFVVSEGNSKIVEGPVKLERLYEGGRNVFKMQLTSKAPPQEMKVKFKVCALSTGFFGCDIIEQVEMDVKMPEPLPQEDTAAEDDELDKLDERKTASDDNDSEEEEEIDVSDIDTDTEDED